VPITRKSGAIRTLIAADGTLGSCWTLVEPFIFGSVVPTAVCRAKSCRSVL
jgi:hypothetical protein